MYMQRERERERERERPLFSIIGLGEFTKLFDNARFLKRLV